ncbi:MAG: hypothetical protein OCD01_14580 [Fibrobacterales bacterium]
MSKNNTQQTIEKSTKRTVQESEQERIYKEELPNLRNFKATKPFTIRMPKDIWLQEAEGYEQHLENRHETFLQEGLAPNFLETYHRRAACARIAQGLLSTYIEEERQNKNTFKALFPEAKELRTKLLNRIRFVVRKDDTRKNIVKKITTGRRIADTIQDLVELSMVAEKMMDELTQYNVTPEEVYRAKELGHSLSKLKADGESKRKQNTEAVEIRNAAVALLRDSISELQDFVKMLYPPKDPNRTIFFSSFYRGKNKQPLTSDPAKDVKKEGNVEQPAVQTPKDGTYDGSDTQS